ncbi:MAG: chorismate synthase [Tannerella sp.]|jgi:chorismate synthase|nr:chorismate synthase [Tannerella sp.]
MNTFGNIFRLTTFGESHGACIGGVIDGCPAGLEIDADYVQHELNRRRPGQSAVTTSRCEADRVEFLSGICEGVATGAPVGFAVWNEDRRSQDYDVVKDAFRPSHADYTYQVKYGIRDPRGGGRASARETVARCVGGAVAKLALAQRGITVQAYTSRVGRIGLDGAYTDYDLGLTESNPVRCPDPDRAAEMEALIMETKSRGDTVGGIVACVVKGVPAGLGEPVFGKLHAALGAAMLSINAAKGFDYGIGFDTANLFGSEQNDIFYRDGERVRTRTNFSGGIQGGISNGEDIYFRVAFKAVATLATAQPTVDCDGRDVLLHVRGRHDPCVLPRAVPIVEAMAAMTVFDYLCLSAKNDRIFSSGLHGTF